MKALRRVHLLAVWHRSGNYTAIGVDFRVTIYFGCVGRCIRVMWSGLLQMSPDRGWRRASRESLATCIRIASVNYFICLHANWYLMLQGCICKLINLWNWTFALRLINLFSFWIKCHCRICSRFLISLHKLIWKTGLCSNGSNKI